jgi:hypothetical protein
MTTDFKIRDAIKLQIVQELIEPYYIHDIESKIRGKKCWKKTAQIFETVSKVLVAVGGIISFSSGYYKDETLSFFAGTISTLSLATLQFASFAYLENKKQGQELNVLLKKLDLDIVPIVEQHTVSQQQNPPSTIELEAEPLFRKSRVEDEEEKKESQEDSLQHINHSLVDISHTVVTVPNLKEQ